jgi:hypothetical protein
MQAAYIFDFIQERVGAEGLDADHTIESQPNSLGSLTREKKSMQIGTKPEIQDTSSR